MAPCEEKEEESKDSPLLKELKKLDDQYLAIERESEKAVLALQEKHREKMNPLFDERRDVLLKTEEGAAVHTGTPACQGFWLKALQNHPAFEDKIEEWDEPVLEYITDIRAIDFSPDSGRQGIKLTFQFAENPYFENTELCKEYTTEEVSPYSGDQDVKEITSTTIEWKAGKDVTKEWKSKKKGGAKRTKSKVVKEEIRKSFFRSFWRNLQTGMTLPEDLAEEALELEEDFEGEDAPSVLGFIMEHDYSVACAMKDSIVPFAVRWYTGEAAEEEDDDDDDEDEEEEEDDDDDDDEDSDESDEAPAKSKSKARGGAAGAKKPGQGPQGAKEGDAKENCKQQ